MDLCLCDDCQRDSARGRAARKKHAANVPFPRKVFAAFKVLLLPPFILTLGYKILSRLSPIDIVTALFSDVCGALTGALRLLFVWPLEVVGASPSWLLGQCRLLFHDLKTAAGFIPVFGKIAMRLGGAYVGVRYVLPFLLTIFIVWPFEIFSGEQLSEDERAAAAATNVMAALLAERAAAIERERGGRANRRGINRRQ